MNRGEDTCKMSDKHKWVKLYQSTNSENHLFKDHGSMGHCQVYLNGLYSLGVNIVSTLVSMEGNYFGT